MRRTLAAASACLSLAALTAPAFAQDPVPPPPPAPEAGAATSTTVTSTTTSTTTTATQPSDDAAPPPPGPPPPPAPPPEPALRDGGLRVGTLSCRAAGGWGLLIGSRRPISCIYQGSHGTEHYQGDLTKIGLDIGYKGKGEVVWTVVAPTDFVRPGDLAGHYGGLTAGASVVVGLAANALVGGNSRQISLQPLSIEGNTGLNASAGIGGLNLHYTGLTG